MKLFLSQFGMGNGNKSVTPDIKISSILPNPIGKDAGNETVTLYSPNLIDLNGWFIRDNDSNTLQLSGQIMAGDEAIIHIPNDSISLNPAGDTLSLFKTNDQLVHRVTYAKKNVKIGQTVTFSAPDNNQYFIHIHAVLPKPVQVDEQTRQIILKAVELPQVNLRGWQLADRANHVFKFNGSIQPGQVETFKIDAGTVSLNNDGDELVLVDSNGTAKHKVSYTGSQVRAGIPIDFPAKALEEQGKCRGASLFISSVLPSFETSTTAKQVISFKAVGGDVQFDGWKICNSSGQQYELHGSATSNEMVTFYIQQDKVTFSNEGDSIMLMNSSGNILHSVKYTKQEVKKGVVLDFGVSGTAIPRLPTVYISSLLPNPIGHDTNQEIVTLTAYGGDADLNGWKITDHARHQLKIKGTIPDGKTKTFFMKGVVSLNNKGDTISLVDRSGHNIQTVSYKRRHVKPGVLIDFDAFGTPTSRVPTILISSMLPNPFGRDEGHETITLKVIGGNANLKGWKLVDRANHKMDLEGTASAGETITFLISKGTVSLNNNGDEISLINAEGVNVHTVSYTRSDVSKGVIIDFDNIGQPKPRLPTVLINSMLPDPVGRERGRTSVSLRVIGANIDFSGWKMIDRVGHEFPLENTALDGEIVTFYMTQGSTTESISGDKISLVDNKGYVVHTVTYRKEDVKSGVIIDFDGSGTASARSPTVLISSLLPNPFGRDKGQETITLQANGGDANVSGWKVVDQAGHTLALNGTITDGKPKTFIIRKSTLSLNNNGDVISLIDSTGYTLHTVKYSRMDVVEGALIDFDVSGDATPRLPTVLITSMLPNPYGMDRGNETVTLTVYGGSVDFTGWQLKDRANHVMELEGNIMSGQTKTFILKPDTVSLNNDGDEISLIDATGTVVQTVLYTKQDVKEGVMIDFDGCGKPQPRLPTVLIGSMLSNALKKDGGRTSITVKVSGGNVDFSGWKLMDSNGRSVELTGATKDGEMITFYTSSMSLSIGNRINELTLYNASDEVIHRVEYRKGDVKEGSIIDFSSSGLAIPRVPTVLISSALPIPITPNTDSQYITVSATGATADINGWKLMNHAGQIFKLRGTIEDGRQSTLLIKKEVLAIKCSGDVIALLDSRGYLVQKVSIKREHVKPGTLIDFEPSGIPNPRLPTVLISSLLPDPVGRDAGRETFTLSVSGCDVNLQGWVLRDRANHTLDLEGAIADGDKKTFVLPRDTVSLNNSGDEISLVNPDENVVHTVVYGKEDVYRGVIVDFDISGQARPRVPTVFIHSILPNPIGRDEGRETVTLTVNGGNVDLSGWKLLDRAGHSLLLSGSANDGDVITFALKKGTVSLNNKGDELSLMDSKGNVIHSVVYRRRDVMPGVIIDFDNTVDAKPRLPTVLINSVMPSGTKLDKGRFAITLKIIGAPTNFNKWKLIDSHGTDYTLDGTGADGDLVTFYIREGTKQVTDGDKISLVNAYGYIVHTVTYRKENVIDGVMIDFDYSGIGTARLPTVLISSLLANPVGRDRGQETITLHAEGGNASVNGWKIVDAANHVFELSGSVMKGQEKTFVIKNSSLSLNNNGDVISLIDTAGHIVHTVKYTSTDVVEGTLIDFDVSGVGRTRLPTVLISSLLPDPYGMDKGRETVTVQVYGGSVTFDGWVLRDRLGGTYELSGSVKPGENKTFTLNEGSARLNNDGDEISIIDASGNIVHTVIYTKEEVTEGVMIDYSITGEAKPRVPTVLIGSMMSTNVKKTKITTGGTTGSTSTTSTSTTSGTSNIKSGKTGVTVKVNGGKADFTGWKLMVGSGEEVELDSTVTDGDQTTFYFKDDVIETSNDVDEIQLVDNTGYTVHSVEYKKDDMKAGALVDFGSSGVPRPRFPTVLISSLLPTVPSRSGSGDDYQYVTIDTSGGEANVGGYKIINQAGEEYKLEGSVTDGQQKTFGIKKSEINMNPNGDVIKLVDSSGYVLHTTKYDKTDVVSGALIDFDVSGTSQSRLPTVLISSMLPLPYGLEKGGETITVQAYGGNVDLSGWTLVDGVGSVMKLSGTVVDGERCTFVLNDGTITLNDIGDAISLVDSSGYIVQTIYYSAEHVQKGVMIDFDISGQPSLRLPTVLISSIIPSPSGLPGGDVVNLNITGGSSNLTGYMLMDLEGNYLKLESYIISAGQEQGFLLREGTVSLKNKGNTLLLLDACGYEVHRVTYSGCTFMQGVAIDFNAGWAGKIRLPTVQVGSFLPYPHVRNSTERLISLVSRGCDAKIDNWTVIDSAGRSFGLNGTVKQGQDKSFIIDTGDINLGKDGDVLTIIDGEGYFVDRVCFDKKDVYSGVMVDFRTTIENTLSGKPRILEYLKRLGIHQ